MRNARQAAATPTSSAKLLTALITSARRWCPRVQSQQNGKLFLDVNNQIGLGELAAQTLNLGL
jgi:hypothetical protein